MIPEDVTTPDARKTLVVVYGWGSVSPTQIKEAASKLDLDLIFIVGDTPHDREIEPVLRTLGTVIRSGDPRSILAQVQREPSSLLPITFAESKIAETAVLAAALGFPYTSPEDVAGLVDKFEQRTALARAGISVPRWELVTRPDELRDALCRLTFPAVIKPVIGAGSRGTFRIENGDGMKGVLNDIVDAAISSSGETWILEEELQGVPLPDPWGDYVGVEVGFFHGRCEVLGVVGKFSLDEPYRERGAFWPSSLSPATNREVCAEAVRAGTALRIVNNVACVELKLTPDGPRVIEVNGRMGAWDNDVVTRGGGRSPLDAALALLAGLPVLPPAEEPQERTFAYVENPPVGASHVDREERKELLATEGVEAVKVHKPRGSTVDWRLGAASSVATITGQCDSLDALAALAQHLRKRKWIGYR